jgi:nitroreductase
MDLPEGSLLLALSSIYWRESWKYGERAFRYCALDAGHASAAISIAAACLG